MAADIFGVTPELGQLARALGADATLASPHPCTRSFRSEAEAYESFAEQGGVAAYARQLGALMTGRGYCFELALGFSAGASALWVCLAEANLEPWLPKSAGLYYGSRIRDYSGLAPRRRARLTFAEHEDSFDSPALAEHLRGLGHNALVLRGSRHGFMNPRSAGYDEALAAKETDRIQALLEVGPYSVQARRRAR
ncbi:dienelactone hydrolase family protein [Humidesulfovibrio sp.]